MEALTGTLVVRRGTKREFARLPRLAVLVDGRVVAKLRPGQVVEVDLRAAPHTVRARMAWTKSKRLDVWVGPAERVEVGVSLRPVGLRAVRVLCGLTDRPDDIECPMV